MRQRNEFSLPELQDIWALVFTRLPVKTLLNFRCVCKEWRSLIDSPYFESMHLNNFNNNCKGTHLLLLQCPSNPGNDIGRQWAVHRSDTFRKSFELHNPRLDFYTVRGYVNGVVLIHDHMANNNGVILGNPSVGHFKRIISSPILNTKHLQLGLGFDPLSNDYKVLAISHPNRYTVFAEVYSHQTGCWKIIQDGVPPASFKFYGPQLFLKGAIYQLGILQEVKEKIKSHQILSFDVGSEAFSYINLPDGVNQGEWMDSFLVVLDESLVVLDAFKEYSFIWTMGKHETHVSWSKRYTINVQWPFRFLCFKKNGEMLFAKGKQSLALVKGFNEQQVRSLPSNAKEELNEELLHPH
ncbi:hypothetical protein Ancab_000398 [Ancistrocladus abbreviatus]